MDIEAERNLPVFAAAHSVQHALERLRAAVIQHEREFGKIQELDRYMRDAERALAKSKADRIFLPTDDIDAWVKSRFHRGEGVNSE